MTATERSQRRRARAAGQPVPPAPPKPSKRPQFDEAFLAGLRSDAELLVTDADALLEDGQERRASNTRATGERNVARVDITGPRHQP